MKKSYILYITTSLMVLSPMAQAGEDISVTCEELGYTVPVSECLEKGSVPLLCPVAEGETDDEKMSLCYSDSCRGFPLWKEDGVYYHLDKNGNKVVAAPETGKFGDYIEGGEDALLTCKTGLASDARTYYKVKKCKDKAILDYDICANGCGKNKYPYDKHPGDLAGAVASCEDEVGEHFGYTSCNDGWDFKDGQCILANCDIKEYPYMGDPNLINNENRGETVTCRIGGNIYYRYDECDAEKVDGSGNPIYTLRKGICIKRCPLQNCTATPITIEKCIPVRDDNGVIKSYNSCTYNDWSCDIDSTCRIGDFATYEGKDLGVIYYLKKGASDKNLVIGFDNSVGIKWAAGEYETYDLPNMPEPGSSPRTDYFGKLYTTKLINFTDNYTSNFPGPAYCYNYTKNCSEGSVCAKHEWYLPSIGELLIMQENVYVISNSSYRTDLVNGTSFFSSRETGTESANKMVVTTTYIESNYKSGSWIRTFPILAF